MQTKRFLIKIKTIFKLFKNSGGNVQVNKFCRGKCPQGQLTAGAIVPGAIVRRGNCPYPTICTASEVEKKTHQIGLI